MRYTGPKNRIARREGMDLGLKTPGTKAQANLLKKVTVIPGQHGARNRRKTSEASRQLREKQKLRYMFGITETQLKNYFQKAIKKTGNTGLNLSLLLEKRLDNVLYRLGMAPTRAASRQLVSHRHVAVNGKMLSIPSYQVRIGDVISYKGKKTTAIPYVETAMSNKDMIVPEWLEKKDTSGSLVKEPSDEILAKQVNLRLVVEFYSR